MSGDENLDNWVCEGWMEMDTIMDRLIKINTNGRPQDISFTKRFYEHATKSKSGEWHTSEEGFLSFLHEHGFLPLSLREQGHILYQSFLYFSTFPFVRMSPKAMTLDEFFRACEFSGLLEEALLGGGFWVPRRYRTVSDRRRLVFQSLATTHDGRKLPFDAEESSRQAAWRSTELKWKDVESTDPDETLSQHLEKQQSNCDQHGDEMYYDIFIVVSSSRPLLRWPMLYDEYFHELARGFHGNDLYLHHLSIPRNRFRCLVKFLLLGQFGYTGSMEINQFPDLDQAVDSIVRPFFRIPGVGITWPMFDDAIRLMPNLLEPISEIAASFFRDESIELASPDLDRMLKDFGTFLTFARFTQFKLCFGSDLVWDKLKVAQRYEAPCNVKHIVEALSATDPGDSVRLTVLLIHGKTLHTGKEIIFGAIIPNPSVDCSAISDASEEYASIHSCCLFELSPGHDMSRGNIGRPGWTGSRDRLCFGDPHDGAAMVLEANMTRATLIKNVNQTDPVYSVSPWREDGLVEVCVESIEIWKATRK